MGKDSMNSVSQNKSLRSSIQGRNVDASGSLGHSVIMMKSPKPPKPVVKSPGNEKFDRKKQLAIMRDGLRCFDQRFDI